MAVPKTMQAWTIRIGEPVPVRKTVNVPTLKHDEVLVKVQAAGVCHSDCGIQALSSKADLPITGIEHWADQFVLGHEGAGEVVQLGPGVDDTKIKVGERVAIHITTGCRREDCPECSRGLSVLCRYPGSGNYGLGRDGTFAEYLAIKSSSAVKIPANVPVEIAAVSSDAVLTAYHAVKRTANVQPQQTVAIFGLGGLGLNALQTALHLQAKRILVVDKRQGTIDEAIKLGIPPHDTFCTADASAKPIQDFVRENGIHVDTCFDFVGHEGTMLSAQLTARPGGAIVLVGLISPQVPLITFAAVMNALAIKASYGGTVESFRECLELISQGVIEPRIETGSVESLPQALKDLDEGRVKSRMVLLPSWNT